MPRTLHQDGDRERRTRGSAQLSARRNGPGGSIFGMSLGFGRSSGRFVSRPLELELLDAIANLIAVQAEKRGGTGLIPAAPFECLDNERPLELFEIEARSRKRD